MSHTRDEYDMSAAIRAIAQSATAYVYALGAGVGMTKEEVDEAARGTEIKEVAIWQSPLP